MLMGVEKLQKPFTCQGKFRFVWMAYVWKLTKVGCLE